VKEEKKITKMLKEYKKQIVNNGIYEEFGFQMSIFFLKNIP